MVTRLLSEVTNYVLADSLEGLCEQLITTNADLSLSKARITYYQNRKNRIEAAIKETLHPSPKVSDPSVPW